jgi:hypothetical protein
MKNLLLISIIFILLPISVLAEESLEEMQLRLDNLKSELNDRKENLKELEQEAGVEEESGEEGLSYQINFNPPEIKYYKAEILSIRESDADENSENYQDELVPYKDVAGNNVDSNKKRKKLEIKILSADKKGEVVTLDNNLLGNPYSLDLNEGDSVYLNSIKYQNQDPQFIIKDYYHLDWIIMWAVVLAIAIIVIGRKKGFLALLNDSSLL